jgi:hypothetical protein
VKLKNKNIMKTKQLKLIAIALLLIGFTLPFESLKADPPRWAPAHGYRAKTRQIYFPRQNMYYDMHRGVYIYISNGRWVTDVRLPAIYAEINLLNVPKVELQINSDYPYRLNRQHVYNYRYRNENMHRREYRRDDDRNYRRERRHEREERHGRGDR